MNNIFFRNTEFLLLIPIMIFIFFLSKSLYKKKFNVLVPTLNYLRIQNLSYKKFLIYLLNFFRILLLLSLVLVLTEPYIKKENIEKKYVANDIIIAMDVSGSMLANDFQPNRLKVAINKAIEFVELRENDRIGVVIYAAESLLLSPLTFQKNFLIDKLNTLKSGILQDGTAIGMGIATAVNALENSKAKHKIIILLTDGVNNSGLISPIDAAEIAKRKNIKIYPIGIGKTGKTTVPKFSDGTGPLIQVDVFLDENSLKKIAEITGGTYFSADSEINLHNSYLEIHKFETNESVIIKYNENVELAVYLLIFSFILLFIDLFLRLWIIRIYP